MLNTSCKDTGHCNVEKKDQRPEDFNEDFKASNKVKSQKDKPSILVKPSLKIENSPLVTSSSELERAASPSNQKDRNLLSVKKRKSRTPVSDSKIRNKIPIDWDAWENLSPRRWNVEDCVLDIVPPSIDSLKESHLKKYQKRLFDKMLDYNIITDDHFCVEDKRGRKVKLLLDDILKQYPKSEDSHLIDKSMCIIRNYLVGVKLLKWREEKEYIKEAAKEKLPHAMYTCALITLRQAIQCHQNNHDSNKKKSKPPAAKELKEAIRYMLDVKYNFFPLPNFVLGIIQLYNIDFLSKLVEDKSYISNPWRAYLDDVLVTGISVEGGETSDVWFNILNSTSHCKGYLNLMRNQNNHQNYMDVLQDKDGEYLKWMVLSLKLELAKKFLSEENLTLAKSLLEELSSQGFVDAEYFYATALLTNAFRDVQIFESHNFNKAFDLLSHAVKCGHQEAMLLFGTLPFRKELDIEKERRDKGWECINCLANYVRAGNDDFRKEAAKLLASEYLKMHSCYLAYDQEKATEILAENGCSDELQQLEINLQARQQQMTRYLMLA